MTDLNITLTSDALLVIPCSGAKREGSTPGAGTRLTELLEPSIARRLLEAREFLSEEACVDDTSMPAVDRYTGELYARSRHTLHAAIVAGHDILIISGAYGLVLPEEPIGCYEKVFHLRNWPKGLLEQCIVEYAKSKQKRKIIAILARSTDYAKLIRRVNWRSAGMTAQIISPRPFGGGMMKTVPRAQGEAIAKIVTDGLPSDWRSSDSFQIDITNLPSDECL